MIQAVRFLLQVVAAVALLAAPALLFPTLFVAPDGTHLALLGAIAGWAAKAVGRTVGGLINNGKGKVKAAVTGAVGGAAAAPILRAAGIPSLPSGFVPQGTPTPPAGPVKRFVQRLIPGGETGREYTPYEGTEIDRYGRPIAVHPDTVERLKAPPGYVIVYPWGPAADPIAMLKGAARAMGLWSPRPKPPVSGWDMRAINRAHSASKRVKKLAGRVGFSCKPKGRG